MKHEINLFSLPWNRCFISLVTELSSLNVSQSSNHNSWIFLAFSDLSDHHTALQMPLRNIQAVPGVGQASEPGHCPPVSSGGPVRPGLSCLVSRRQRRRRRPARSPLSPRFAPSEQHIKV